MLKVKSINENYVTVLKPSYVLELESVRSPGVAKYSRKTRLKPAVLKKLKKYLVVEPPEKFVKFFENIESEDERRVSKWLASGKLE